MCTFCSNALFKANIFEYSLFFLHKWLLFLTALNKKVMQCPQVWVCQTHLYFPVFFLPLACFSFFNCPSQAHKELLTGALWVEPMLVLQVELLSRICTFAHIVWVFQLPAGCCFLHSVPFQIQKEETPFSSKVITSHRSENILGPN